MKQIILFSLLLLSLSASPQAFRNIAIGQLSVSDPDGDELRYEIVDGNREGFFKITEDAIILVKREAYKTFAKYRTFVITIKATDPGGLSVKTEVTITLRKTNDGQIIKPKEQQIIA